MKTNRQHFLERYKKALSALAMLIYLVMTLLVIWFIGRPMMRFASQPERFREWVDTRGVWSRIGYMGMVLLQVFVAVIPGEPLEIGGGYAFGVAEGTLLCMAAAAAGSVLVFAFVRCFGIRLVEVFYSREKIRSLRFLRSSPKRDLLFLFLFLIPGTPKDLLCYFAGLTDMRWTVWLFICSVGRLPSIVTSTLSGNALGTKHYQSAAVTASVTLGISLLGVLMYRLICRANEKKAHTKQEMP